MKFSRRLKWSLLLLLSFVAPVYAEGCITWPQDVFSHLDYGFYWVKESQGQLGVEEAVKASYRGHAATIPSKDFYDPTKPTIIYFHGWEPDSTLAMRREDFCYRDPQSNQLVVDSLKPWKERGWNVAIFYWQQFSDDFPLDAQKKVYSADGIRWKYIDAAGNTHTAAGGTNGQSIAAAALSDFTAAMPNYSGPELRIVGHSLGGQLSIQFTQSLIHAINNGSISNRALMPKRLTLLDPVFSPLPTSYLPDMQSTAQKNYADLLYIENNCVAVDGVDTSPLSEITSPYTTQLQDNIAMEHVFETDIDKSFFIFTYGKTKGDVQYDFALHRAARFIYFNSLDELPHVNYPDGGMPPSAATSNERTWAMMHDGYPREQITGTNTYIQKKS